ncbi:MAG: hypothetical protein MRJ92_07675 [Nitrospira sp.]|nr:hypothetical protein [Nitrospira sp.]
MIELIKSGPGDGMASIRGFCSPDVLPRHHFLILSPTSEQYSRRSSGFGELALFAGHCQLQDELFRGESRLLPVSLSDHFQLTFMMALLLTNISALLKIGGFVLHRGGLVWIWKLVASSRGWFPAHRRKERF